MAQATPAETQILELLGQQVGPIHKKIDALIDRSATNFGQIEQRQADLESKCSETFGHMTHMIHAIEKPAAPDLSALYAALAVAQGQIQSAIADKENTHFNFKYADLDSCWDACRKPLSSNGLAIIQIPSNGESGAVIMRSILTHETGVSIEASYTMHPDKTTPQAIASCMTYLRRYLLCAMVGISQEDDDGNAAEADPNDYDRITTAECEKIIYRADELFSEKADDVVGYMLGKVFNGIGVIGDIRAGEMDVALTYLNNAAALKAKKLAEAEAIEETAKKEAKAKKAEAKK